MVGGNAIGGIRQPELKPQRYDTEKIIQHPDWNLAEFRKGNDLALVRVKGLIKLYVSLASVNYVPIYLYFTNIRGFTKFGLKVL